MIPFARRDAWSAVLRGGRFLRRKVPLYGTMRLSWAATVGSYGEALFYEGGTPVWYHLLGETHGRREGLPGQEYIKWLQLHKQVMSPIGGKVEAQDFGSKFLGVYDTICSKRNMGGAKAVGS